MLKLTTIACCLLLALQQGYGQSTTPAGTGGSGSGTGGASGSKSGSGTGGGSSSGTGGGSSSGTGGGSSSGTGGGSSSGTGGGSQSGSGGGSSSGTGGGSQSGSGTGGGSSTGQQSTKSNYYVDYFNSVILVGYAIDQCSSYDLLGQNFVMPHCTSTSTVTASYYTGGSCTGTPSSTKKLNSSSSGLFSCSQTANNYAKVSFGISGVCGISVYAAADACVPYSSYYAAFSCLSSTSGAFRVFSNNQCSTSVTMYALNSTCYSPFSISGTAVDFQLADCYLGTTATTTSSSSSNATTSTTSSASMIGLQNIIGVFIIVVCIIFATI